MDSGWGKAFFISATVMQTELGLCRTVNFAEPADFLHEEVDGKRIFQGIYDWNKELFPETGSIGSFSFEPENETQPYMTTSVNLGFKTTMFYDKNKKRNQNRTMGINPGLLMIHSPFEFPKKGNQKFTISGLNKDTFWVTPQITKIDDSMIGMEPHEY